jgi:hypothetical protein
MTTMHEPFRSASCALPALALAFLLLAAAAPPALAQAVDLGALPAPLAERAAEHYREAARYPDHARALPPGAADPVRAKRTPAPHSRAGDGPDAPVITVWAGEVSYEHPRPVDLYATVERPAPGKAVPGRALAATVHGEVVTAGGELVGTVAYRDDGEGADRRAGDGIHSALFSFPADVEPELAASYGVRVRAVTGDGEEVGVIGGFLYADPDARLTGRFRDALRDGDLVVEAEVVVEEAGRFHLAGTVGDAKGAPLGWAQTAAELEPGTHWLELSFYGLMFRERGAAGPFRLLSAALSTTTSMPNALNDLVEDGHRTGAYPLARFTAQPYGNPDLLHAADRLLRGKPRAE